MKSLLFQNKHYGIMLAQVMRCLPEEACGLLAGKHEIIEEILPITNRLHSPDRFEMDPLEQLEAFNHIEDRNLNLVGIYHSHPGRPAFPSKTDLQNYAYPGAAYVIWSIAGEAWVVHGFMIENGSYAEISVSFSSSE